MLKNPAQKYLLIYEDSFFSVHKKFTNRCVKKSPPGSAGRGIALSVGVAGEDVNAGAEVAGTVEESVGL